MTRNRCICDPGLLPDAADFDCPSYGIQTILIPAIESHKERRRRVRVYRQGDVLIAATDDLPDGLRAVKREHGKTVLAHGEVTGHHHAILDKRAELFAPDGSSFVTVDEAAELYLLVHGDGPVDLVHEEHATIQIEPGSYRVVRQREYTPEALRRVAD